MSEYGLQLAEKQKVKALYNLLERQFYRYYDKARRNVRRVGENLLSLLETRLDNLVYRMGFARTRRGARQLVNHGHVLVNGKKVDIPSYSVKPGAVIEIKERSKNMASINDALEANLNTVAFVDVDKDAKKGTYLRLPERSELNSEILGWLDEAHAFRRANDSRCCCKFERLLQPLAVKVQAVSSLYFS